MTINQERDAGRIDPRHPDTVVVCRFSADVMVSVGSLRLFLTNHDRPYLWCPRVPQRR